MADAMPSGRVSVIYSAIVSVFVQHYCKSNQISYQSAELINYGIGGDSVPNTDSGSLFCFPHYCGIGIL